MQAGGPRAVSDIVHTTLPMPVKVLGSIWAVAIILSTALVVSAGRTSGGSQIVGNISIFLAIAFAAVSCVLAARHRSPARLAWSLMAGAMFLGALGQLGYVVNAVSGAAAAPSVAGDVFGFIGYAVPSLAAILAFPRRAERLISRFRQILDVLVITVGTVLISEATVLGPVRAVADPTTPEGLLLLAYPISDIAICALVLCLGMRQLPGDRITWFFLGSGLVMVAVTDSVYVRLLAEGQTELTATALVAGWMAGPVLIGLAAFVPMTHRASHGRDFTLVLQLVPYVPVIGAMIVLSLVPVLEDGFLVVTALVLLVAVSVRQVMIVYENVSLTRDLEAKVASRTAELTTLGSIVTSSTDAIVGVSLDNVITAWNPAAERLYGHPAPEVIGRPPTMLLPDEAAEIDGLLQSARRGEQLNAYEIDWERPDGTVVPVAMTVSSIVDETGVQGISVFAQDITERRRAAETLERARLEALESSRLKSEFLATMSHEIRTPMNGVIGLTTLLLETDLDETQRQYAEGVQSAGEALLAVINDILDFSKLEAGKVVLDLSDFSPRRLIEEVGALLAPAASAKRLELIAYCLPEVPEAVHGDAGRLRQILLNLASNAVKFTPDGEVVIRVRSAARQDRVTLRFEVVDSGIGISESDQGRLFESFSQADASTTRRFGGTGLGLAICRRLVEVMGGRIGLESEVGVGSTFWFEVTLRLAAAAKPPLNELSHDLLKDLRVLVVDDNATNRTILKAQLEAWQMRPDLADTAASAFQRLRSTALDGHPYDLAALDMQMPDVDGLDLARRVSADPLLEGLPMIMLTSSMQLDPELMRAAGVHQWLSKPVRSSELFDRLMRLMVLRESELQARRHHPVAVTPRAVRGRLLIVEDNALNRLVAERIVARLGFETDCVTDGAAAVVAVAARTYDAVLMDCHMPTMDGFQATREIRSMEGSDRHTPIIAMTAGALVEDRERCLASGMDDHVSKPIDSDVLDTTLGEVIRRRSDSVQPVPTAGSNGSQSGDVLDRSRLADLAELTAPDGSSLLRSMIDSYLEHSADRLRVLSDAVAAGDLATTVSAGHELKGASGTIGATRVMALAAELERSARAGEQPRPGLIEELRTEVEAATRALEHAEVSVP